MIYATFSELRNNARRYFDAVEKKGESIQIHRHGRPVAVLSPFQARSMERWKRAHPVRLKGVSGSRWVLEGRRVRL